MRLAEVIGRFIGKVEIVLAGADDDLREGELALAAGDSMRARAAAHRVLAAAPGSPLALALLADACEAANLDAELALTLEELAQRAPSRAEVWIRLARARHDTRAPADEVRDALVRALGVAETGSDARRDALLELTDLDLSQGNSARADLWLERLPVTDRSNAVAVRRAEVHLARGEAAAARDALAGLDVSPADGRAALARGRALAQLGDPEAFLPLVRAFVLDVPGASEALSGAVASLPSDGQMRARVRSVVDAKGEQDWARWRAAFARAEGARDAARHALRDALASGDRAAATPLLDAAVEDQDAPSLEAALAAGPAQRDDPFLRDAGRIVVASRSEAVEALQALAFVRHPRLEPWAEALAARVAAAWVPESGAPSEWSSLLARLDADARALGDLDAVAALAELAAERSRPLRLAVIGEFNAGKSTFINALIGADVAPTGVLPTTATLHHLRWAPDSIARIFFARGHDPPERIVPLSDLRGTLRSLDAEAVDRVELLLPLEFLVRVEILDTPGFNAPDPRHTRLAREAFAQADTAIWLLDATQAMKQSERAVLDEAKAAGLPLQMFVNKADRLAPAELERVMAAVRDALAETRITSLAAPQPLSAKKALAGRLGDAKALAESGWEAVKGVLDEQIIARHAEWKERALRRRTLAVVRRLAGRATEDAERRRSQERAAAERTHRTGQRAAALEREPEAATAAVTGALRPAAEAWSRDLALVYVGRDREGAARDPTLRRYRVERAVSALAAPLSKTLEGLAPEAQEEPGALQSLARAVVGAAVEASSSDDADVLLPPLARAAVRAWTDRLFVMSAAPDGVAAADGVARELRAFAAQLARATVSA